MKFPFRSAVENLLSPSISKSVSSNYIILRALFLEGLSLWGQRESREDLSKSKKHIEDGAAVPLGVVQCRHHSVLGSTADLVIIRLPTKSRGCLAIDSEATSSSFNEIYTIKADIFRVSVGLTAKILNAIAPDHSFEATYSDYTTIDGPTGAYMRCPQPVALPYHSR